MVREGSVVSAMSDARRLQLRRDRLRTKAISLFLADHREALLRNLRKAGSMGSNVKRKALEAEARKKFKEATDSVRDHYMNIAGAKAQDTGQDAKQATGQEQATGQDAKQATGQGAKQGSGGFGERRCETQAPEEVHSTDPHRGPQSSSSEMPRQTPVKRQKVAEAFAVAPRSQRLRGWPLVSPREVDSGKVDSGKDFGKNLCSQGCFAWSACQLLRLLAGDIRRCNRF